MMSILTKAKKLSIIAVNPQIITCRTKYLFIFSHMRSRSTVLSHVLGSNPNICGYSELHISYLNRMNLVKMRINLFQDLKCELRDKYLLDKLLHNSHIVSNKIYEIAKPKVIFLIRDAENTIKSIIDLGDIRGIERYKDPKSALDYYCSRLLYLEEYARKIRGGYFFIESNELVNNTDNVLESLSKWLKLDEPLDKYYSTFSNTSKPYKGDSSHNIRSGIIKKTKDHHHIQVPLEVLQRGKSSYEKCKSSLLEDIISRNITIAETRTKLKYVPH